MATRCYTVSKTLYLFMFITQLTNFTITWDRKSINSAGSWVITIYWCNFELNNWLTYWHFATLGFDCWQLFLIVDWREVEFPRKKYMRETFCGFFVNLIRGIQKIFIPQWTYQKDFSISSYKKSEKMLIWNWCVKSFLEFLNAWNSSNIN